ncbi:MAG: alpha/beta hydrolase family protein [Brachymonas sp.]
MNVRPLCFSPQVALNRRQCLVATAAGLVGLSAPTFANLPAPQLDTWVDASRAGREIPVLLRWPVGQPLGVVLYSHGLGGKREGGDVWGQAWANAGLLVVHLQHAGSDTAALKGGWSSLRAAGSAQQLSARTQDIGFAVAQMKRLQAVAGGIWSAVPLEKLVIGGHSFGARSTLLAAGWQRNGVGGAEPNAKAFIAMSPALGAGVSLEQGRLELARATRPVLLCTGSEDGEVIGNGETPESRRMVFDALPAGKKSLLWLDQADHFTFAGNAKQIPSTFLARRNAAALSSEVRHHEIIARVSTHWLKQQLFNIPSQVPIGLSTKDQWLTG